MWFGNNYLLCFFVLSYFFIFLFVFLIVLIKINFFFVCVNVMYSMCIFFVINFIFILCLIVSCDNVVYLICLCGLINCELKLKFLCNKKCFIKFCVLKWRLSLVINMIGNFSFLFLWIVIMWIMFFCLLRVFVVFILLLCFKICLIKCKKWNNFLNDVVLYCFVWLYSMCKFVCFCFLVGKLLMKL